MANINLGNIRRLGFIKGLADSELARQAARAKIAEEDRAYQRLLERDEALRAYQSAEAEKTRAFTKSQAEILAEQTKARQAIEDARYKDERGERIRQFNVREKRESDAASESIRQFNRNYEIKQDQLNETRLQRQETKKNKKRDEANAIALVEAKSLASQGKTPDATVLGVRHPNADIDYIERIASIYAVEAGGVSKKQLDEKAESIYKDFKNGDLAPELAESSYNILKKANHFSIKDMPFEKFKRQNTNLIMSKKNYKIRSTKTERDFGDNFKANVLRLDHTSGILKDVKTGTPKVRQNLTFLSQDAASIEAGLIEQYGNLNQVPQSVKDNVKKYLEDRISKFSFGSEVTEGINKNATYRLTQKAIKNSVPLLENLFGRDDAQQLLNNAGLRVKRDNIEPYTHKVDQKTTKYYPELNREKVEKFMREQPDVLTMLQVPENIADKTSIEYRRSTLLRQIKTGGYKISTMTKENQPVIAQLMETFVDEKGKLDPGAINEIGVALEAITPENNHTYENGVEREIANPFRKKMTKAQNTEAAKQIREANKNFITSREVINLTDEISALSAGTTASAGQAGRLAGAVDTLVAVVDEVGAYIRDNAQGVFNKITVSIDGKETNLGRERGAALDRLNNNTEDSQAKIKERTEMIAKVETLAAKRIKRYDDAVKDGDMSANEAERRKLIELKKIALTYRMSGILQGDSSGRTISNQDFDVALQAVWTEGAFLGARMADVKKFFQARNNISKAIIDYGDTGLSRVMLGVASEFNKQTSKSYLRQLMPDPNEVLEEGPSEVTTFRSANTGESVSSPQEKISSSNRIIVEDQNLEKGIRKTVEILQKVTKNNDSLSSLTDALKKHKGETRFNYNANPRATNFEKAKETDFNRIIDGAAFALTNQYAEDNNIRDKSRLLELKKDIYMTMVNTLKSRVGLVTTGLEGN